MQKGTGDRRLQNNGNYMLIYVLYSEKQYEKAKKYMGSQAKENFSLLSVTQQCPSADQTAASFFSGEINRRTSSSSI
ncbi:MAG: hypothetical protein LBU32_14430 [Clostridiales bacterium]|nr:hypothetical protein [Clostridiales bacterium]